MGKLPIIREKFQGLTLFLLFFIDFMVNYFHRPDS